MALTDIQRQALEEAKNQGLSKEQAIARVFANPTKLQRPKGTLADIPSDISQTGTELIKGLGSRFQDVKSVTDPANIINRYRQYGGGLTGAAMTAGEMGLVAGGNLVGAGFDVAAAPFMAGGRALMNPREEEQVLSLFNRGLQATGLPQAYEEQTPEGQRNIRAGLGFLDFLGIKGVGRVTRGIKAGEATPTPQTTRPNLQTGLNRPVPSTIDDVINQADVALRNIADDTTLPTRAREEAANASLSFKEKWIGLNPAEKSRLEQMRPQKLREYLDAVHLRNIDDTKPTPYEVGSQNVSKAQEALERSLRDTGSSIGQLREKLATVQAPSTSREAIDAAFNSELARLNLEVNRGVIRQTPGKISPATRGDIQALTDLLSDLRTFKQSPTLSNMIDLRMNFDARVNFNKALRDVSNNIDPVSRNVRKVIAKEAERIVGRTGAADLAKYTDFIEAYGDLKSFTNRQAGGEYLLRLVLSGRGGESRKLIQTIKEYTGIDLMNDATAMKLATELLGNEQTRNLFRQEVTRAGYDVGSLISSGPTGWVGTLAQRLLDKGIDVEDVLINAAKGGTVAGAAYLMIEENPDFAPAIGFAIASVNPAVRKKAVETVAKVVDTPTVGEMQDFVRVIDEGGVSTNNKGELVFKPIDGLTQRQVEFAYQDGLRLIEMDESMADFASETPKEISKFYKDVIAKTESDVSGKSKGATPSTNLLEEDTPKTVKVFIKSKFSDGGAMADIPVIRRVDNVTLYQGGSSDGRQFWTPDKKYAEQFGEVKEKTGSFYQVDNGNRMTDVYVEVHNQSTNLLEEAKYGTASLRDQYPDLAEAMFRMPDEMTVYRGTGKGIGNSTFVKGEYWADSKQFAETFGEVTEAKIPKNAAVFDFDVIKNNPNQTLIPEKLLVDQDGLTEYLIDNGIEYTKNTNARGVEFVKLNSASLDLSRKAKTMTLPEFKKHVMDNYDQYREELARISQDYTMADRSRLRSPIEDIWKQANQADTPNLLEEAKGKGLEEFIESQGTPVYHGSNKTFNSVGEIDFDQGFYTLRRTKEDIDTNAMSFSEPPLPWVTNDDIKKYLPASDFKKYQEIINTPNKGLSKTEILKLDKEYDVLRNRAAKAKLTNEGSNAQTLEGWMKEPAEAFGENVNEFVVDFKNPLIVDVKGKSWLEVSDGEMSDYTLTLINRAKKNGNDGVIIKNITEGFSGKSKLGAEAGLVDDYIALSPDTIKTKSELEEIWNNANK